LASSLSPAQLLAVLLSGMLFGKAIAEADDAKPPATTKTTIADRRMICNCFIAPISSIWTPVNHRADVREYRF